MRAHAPSPYADGRSDVYVLADRNQSPSFRHANALSRVREPTERVSRRRSRGGEREPQPHTCSPIEASTVAGGRVRGSSVQWASARPTTPNPDITKPSGSAGDAGEPEGSEACSVCLTRACSQRR